MNYFFILITIIIFAGLLLVKLKMPVLIGKIGEKFVSNKFSHLDQSQYKIINDLLLSSSGSTSTTQIDHVIVSNFGIFCIETKSYKGWIFGNASQQYWTQVIYRNKQRFYNPLRQNFAHTKAIESIIGNKLKVPVVSFVVFPYADKLKISGTDKVGYTRDIVGKIKNYSSPVYSDTERDEILNLLVNANIKDKEARREHNIQVKTSHRQL